MFIAEIQTEFPPSHCPPHQVLDALSSFIPCRPCYGTGSLEHSPPHPPRSVHQITASALWDSPVLTVVKKGGLDHGDPQRNAPICL